MDLLHGEGEVGEVPLDEVQPSGGGVQAVVQHLAGHIELQVEAGRDHGHHLLLDVWQDTGQQELPPSS